MNGTCTGLASGRAEGPANLLCLPAASAQVLFVGLGTDTDNRTGIFTGISPQNQYFALVYRSTQCCSDLLSLSLSSYINGHSQEFDFYARFRGFLVSLPRAYWQER